MDVIAVGMAIINLLFCAWRTVRSLFAGRLVTLAWLLVSYHSVFLIALTLEGPFSKYRGFSGDYIFVETETIRFLALFALSFNVLFALTESLVWRLTSGRKTRESAWEIKTDPQWLRVTRAVYLVFLIGGSILYWFKMQGGGYRSYVEFQGSNWPQVFLWASTPIMVIAALQRRYWYALASCVPFLFFAVYLKVRSLALLSLIPVAVVFYFQLVGHSAGRRGGILKPVFVGVMMFSALVALSVFVTYKKTADIQGNSNSPGEISGLPDAGMVYSAALVFQATNDTQKFLGFDGLERYGLNAINPFLRLFNVDLETLRDPAVYMAGIIDGVPENGGFFLHYPSLWYSDAFLAFGLAGVLMAVLWGVVMSAWEAFMTRNAMFVAILLPFYTWHAYMLVRGATTIATIPLAYSVYVALLVLLAIAPISRLIRTRSQPV